MTRRIAVGDIMTRNFVSVTPNTNLLTCAKEMVKNRVNSLIISRDQKLLGIITSRDILWVLTKKPGVNLKTLDVEEVATKKIAIIKPSADISEALNKMKQYGFRRLPVLSKGVLVGMVTLKDILKVDPGLYDQLGELTEIREEAQKLQKIKALNWPMEGLCDECSSFAELLKVENRLLCTDCREELY